MRHHSILEYAGFRWLKAALAACALAGIAYLWHDPATKPYGGSPLGYTLGGVSAALVLWLLWFGVRKRRYASGVGSVQGWLSAHVYLGTAVVVLATLHTGFELGWNVHTLAYVLLLAVVASGFYGVYMYLTIPRAMTQNLGEESPESLLLQLGDIDRRLRERALSLPDDLLALADASVRGTRLGGSLRRVLSGRDPGCPTDAAVKRWPGIAARLAGDSARVGKEVFALLLQKQRLLERARRHMRHRALLDAWLLLHVPLAIALLGALVAHVAAVFIYW